MKNIIIFLFFSFLFTACRKNIDELPEATQTGANTFGAKVDGQLWGPIGFGIAPTAPILEARYSGNNSIFINARNFGSSPNETEMEIYLRNVTGPGTYLLNLDTGYDPNQTASYGYYIRRKFNPINIWLTSSQHTGSISITRFDTVNQIISGTFQFNAGSIDSTAAPLNITEGRFDVKIQ